MNEMRYFFANYLSRGVVQTVDWHVGKDLQVLVHADTNRSIKAGTKIAFDVFRICAENYLRFLKHVVALHDCNMTYIGPYLSVQT
jgi:hypothetical protein